MLKLEFLNGLLGLGKDLGELGIWFLLPSVLKNILAHSGLQKGWRAPLKTTRGLKQFGREQRSDVSY
jgi:hypothetical protein